MNSAVKGMERNTFKARLCMATHHAVNFAREYVRQSLPDDVGFFVYPNQSYDGNPRVGDEIVFPDESLPDGHCHGPWAISEVVDFLWRDEKVPEWIDVAVQGENGRQTLIRLLCCGRFSGQEDLLYYRSGEVAPFGIKSPDLPPGWENVAASGKFDVNWRQDGRR